MARPATPATNALLDALADGEWSSISEIEESTAEALAESNQAWCIEAFEKNPTPIQGRVTKAKKALAGATTEIVKSRTRLLARKMAERSEDKTQIRVIQEIASEAPADVPVTIARDADETAEEVNVRVIDGYRIADAPSSKRKVPHLVINGVHENDIFAQAPFFFTERLRWKFEEAFDPQIIVDHLASEGITAWTRSRSDGNGRIWVEFGQGEIAQQKVEAFLNREDIDLKIDGTITKDTGKSEKKAADEQGITFRDLNLMDESLKTGLILATTRWLLDTGMYAKKIHDMMNDIGIVDPEEADGLAYLLVSDWLDTYREDKGVNFRVYASGRVNHLKSDNLRTVNGRANVTAQVAYKQAIETYRSEHFHDPSRLEIAEMLNVSTEKLSKMEREFSVNENIRYAASIVTSNENDEDYSNPSMVIANEVNTEDQALGLNAISTLSAAIASAANGKSIRKPMGTVDPLGLITAYRLFVCGDKVSDVADSLEINHKTVQAAKARMQAALSSDSDLREALS